MSFYISSKTQAHTIDSPCKSRTTILSSFVATQQMRSNAEIHCLAYSWAYLNLILFHIRYHRRLYSKPCVQYCQARLIQDFSRGKEKLCKQFLRHGCRIRWFFQGRGKEDFLLLISPRDLMSGRGQRPVENTPQSSPPATTLHHTAVGAYVSNSGHANLLPRKIETIPLTALYMNHSLSVTLLHARDRDSRAEITRVGRILHEFCRAIAASVTDCASYAGGKLWHVTGNWSNLNRYFPLMLSRADTGFITKLNMPPRLARLPSAHMEKIIPERSPVALLAILCFWLFYRVRD